MNRRRDVKKWGWRRWVVLAAAVVTHAHDKEGYVIPAAKPLMGRCDAGVSHLSALAGGAHPGSIRPHCGGI